MSISNRFAGVIDLMTPPIKTYYIYPDKDSVIFDKQKAYNYGYTSLMTMSKTDLRGNSAVLMNFSGISKVPVEVWSNLIDINLYTYYNGIKNSSKINVYRYDNHDLWDEDLVTWENAPAKGTLLDQFTLDHVNNNRLDIKDLILDKKNNTEDQIGFYMSCEGMENDSFQMYSKEIPTQGLRPRIALRYYDISVSPYNFNGIVCPMTDMSTVESFKDANFYVLGTPSGNLDIVGELEIRSFKVNADITCDNGGLYIPKYSPFDIEITNNDDTVSEVHIGDEYKTFKDIIPSAYATAKNSTQKEDIVSKNMVLAAIAPGSTLTCKLIEDEATANFRVAKLFAMTTIYNGIDGNEIGTENVGDDYIEGAFANKDTAITTVNNNDIVCAKSGADVDVSKCNFVVKEHAGFIDIVCENSGKNLYVIRPVLGIPDITNGTFKVARKIENAAEIVCDEGFTIDPLRYEDIDCKLIADPKDATTKGFRISMMFALTTEFYKVSAAPMMAAMALDDGIMPLSAPTGYELAGTEKTGDDYIVGEYKEKADELFTVNDTDIVCEKDESATFDDIMSGRAEGLFIVAFVPTEDEETKNMTIHADVLGKGEKLSKADFLFEQPASDVDINCEKTPEEDYLEEYIKLSEIHLGVAVPAIIPTEDETTGETEHESDLICEKVEDATFEEVMDFVYETMFIEGSAVTEENEDQFTIHADKLRKGQKLSKADFLFEQPAPDVDIIVCEKTPEEDIANGTVTLGHVNMLVTLPAIIPEVDVDDNTSAYCDIVCEKDDSLTFEDVKNDSSKGFYVIGFVPLTNKQKQKQTIECLTTRITPTTKLSTVNFLVKRDAIEVIEDGSNTSASCDIVCADNGNDFVVVYSVFEPDNKGDLITCDVIPNATIADANRGFLIKGCQQADIDGEAGILALADPNEIICLNNNSDFIIKELILAQISCNDYNKNNDKTLHDFVADGAPGMWYLKEAHSDIVCDNNDADFIVASAAYSYAFIM